MKRSLFIKILPILVCLWCKKRSKNVELWNFFCFFCKTKVSHNKCSKNVIGSWKLFFYCRVPNCLNYKWVGSISSSGIGNLWGRVSCNKFSLPYSKTHPASTHLYCAPPSIIESLPFQQSTHFVMTHPLNCFL